MTEDVWRSAVAVLRDPSRQPGKSARKHLLTGLAQCGNCAAPIGSGVKHRADGVVYVCKKCFKVSRAQPLVDQWVIEHVVQRVSQPDAERILIREDRPDVGKLRDEAAALRSRLDMLATEFADGDLTASQLRTATERIKTRLSGVESQMFDANSRRVFDGLIGAADPRAAFDALSLDRKRAVIDALLTVTIMPVGKGNNRFDPSKVVIGWEGR